MVYEQIKYPALTCTHTHTHTRARVRAHAYCMFTSCLQVLIWVGWLAFTFMKDSLGHKTSKVHPEEAEKERSGARTYMSLNDRLEVTYLPLI